MIICLILRVPARLVEFVAVEILSEGLTSVLAIAEQVPDGANRTVPGAAFKPGV
jgi:hypothetical protein